jgi:uncharacterized protein with von Willebrand factor type A (vWA) domain
VNPAETPPENSETPENPPSKAGLLAENVLGFVRLLRAAGLPLGPDKAIDALQALRQVGLDRRDDFHHALKAVLLSRHEQSELFEQAWQLYWRDPQRAGTQLESLLQQLGSALKRPASAAKPVPQRLAQALWPQAKLPHNEEPPPELEMDAAQTVSGRELLQNRDFASMSPEEWQQARKLVSRLRLQWPKLRTRRFQAQANGGQVDMRASLRQMFRSDPALAPLRRRAPRYRQPALVVLCDISGSMDSYTRMLLHFIHAVSNDRSRVYSFLFGTRLTHITRALRDRDVDVALARVANQVRDWAGGTRIAACLYQFNQHWGRRLLGQGAMVLLITDGLDSDDARQLEQEMLRLSRSCQTLLWLNPLMRYADYEARTAGARAMLPHVDRMVPVHSLASLAQLGIQIRGSR